MRAKYGFALVGYVIMPEHVDFIIGETESASPSEVVQVFKQRVSRFVRGAKGEELEQVLARSADGDAELRRFWQRRYCDFNVYTREKMTEKIEYMHANPVVENLVAHPRDWPWSSWSVYARGEGLLRMDVV